MNLKSGIEWVANLRRAWSPRDGAADFGDMGTAFGLDASLSALMDEAREPKALSAAAPLSQADYFAGLALR